MEDDRSGVTGTWGSNGGEWSVLVHGGAGDVSSTRREARLAGCRKAVLAAGLILEAGGSALDAAQRAVEILEDDPQFNAGTGACLTSEGTLELDASLMEGTSLRAGGVCALPSFRHPITVARAVLDAGGHVLYAGRGAERFAIHHGFTRATDAEMITAPTRARFEVLRAAYEAHGEPGKRRDESSCGDEHGTVGAVDRDRAGSVAAATSTGGRMFKDPGRVGDTPILGAGTYADDGAGAASNTGDGEAVMRLCLAKMAVEWMRTGMHPEEAARAAVRHMLDRTGGTGGIILVDGAGRIGLARTTATMAWAAHSAERDDVVAGF